MAGRTDWIFPLFHRSESPRNAASKQFQRLFKLWGLTDARTEVFHALRHTYKDWARAAGIEERTLALQTGHSLHGVALQYGNKGLRPDEMQKLAIMPLPAQWDIAPYEMPSKRPNGYNWARRGLKGVVAASASGCARFPT